MARHFEPPATDETRGPKVLTLVLVALGGVLALAAAFFVRPAPRIEDKSALAAPVVPAVLLATSVPVKAAVQPEVAKAPSLPADKERLALAMAMAEKSRSLASPSKASPILAPEPIAPPSRSLKPGAGSIQTASTAPVPATSLVADQDSAPTSGDVSKSTDGLSKQMADDAAKAIIAGDIPGARQLLEKSIAAGDKQSVLALAETYDPRILSSMKIKDIKGDAQKARELYERAWKSGIRMAGKRLAALKKFENSH